MDDDDAYDHDRIAELRAIDQALDAIDDADAEWLAARDAAAAELVARRTTWDEFLRDLRDVDALPMGVEL